MAIDELGETLSEHCTRLLRGGGPPGELREQIAELNGLLDLLERIDYSGRR